MSAVQQSTTNSQQTISQLGTSVALTPPQNPFSPCGFNCASELDYDVFPGMFLPSQAAEDTTQFRVDITSFHRVRTTGNVETNPRRVINKASTLSTVLRDSSIPLANAQARPHVTSTTSISGQIRGNSALSSSIDARLTLITIPQEFSGGPVKITRTALQDLIKQLDLPTTFLPILYAFGSVPRISEAGLDSFTSIPHSVHDGSYTITYLYRFKDHDQPDPDYPDVWKDRQIGIFHRHCSLTNEDLFIVLQPHANSLFDGEIEYKIQPDPHAMNLITTNPFYVHQLLITSYFPGWRSYLHDMGETFSKSSAEVFSQDIVKDYSLEFDFLQRWRSLKDSVAPISTTLDSLSRILTGLNSIYRTCIYQGTLSPCSDFEIFITLTSSQTEGLLRSTSALDKRISNIADLLTNTIETRNQMDAAKLNRSMERLTLDTLDDSTSVKIITFLSLFYLPGSFVATLFGMNLFGFDTGSRQIVIAQNFWLYVVFFVPLTALTSGGAWVAAERAKKRREERDRKFGVIRIRGSP